MKTPHQILILTLTLILSSTLTGYSQDKVSLNASDKKLVSAAKEIMNAAGICALITLDDAGRPRARAMDAFPPEDDLTVWFGTNSKSRKVKQIRNDPRVTLYYQDSDDSGYVMIYGIARLIDDPEEKKLRWKEAWEAFYPENRENYLLIKVSPVWMEISSTPRGIMSDTVSWEPPSVDFEEVK